MRYRILGPWGAAYRGNTGHGGPKYRTGNDGPCRVECRMLGGVGWTTGVSDGGRKGYGTVVHREGTSLQA